MTTLADRSESFSDQLSTTEPPVSSLTLVPSEAAAPPPQVDHRSRAGQDSDIARRLAVDTDRRLVEAAGAAAERRDELLDEVVLTHLWLAETLARRFRHRGEDDQDLLQVARAGLVAASRRFDPERGAFLAFAIPTITGVLKRHFRDLGWSVRPPRRIQELAAGIRQGWPTLVQSLGTIPTDTHLAAHLGASVAEVREARCASEGYTTTLLDAEHQSDGDVDQYVVETEQLETRLLLAKIWPLFDPGEQDLIRLRFYEELSQVQIAALLGTSQMHVSRDLARLLVKFRSLIGDDRSIAS